MERSESYTLITGASSGLGKATALMLANSRNLILNGRNRERLEAVGKECEDLGAKVMLFPFDLEKANEVGSALKDLLLAHGLKVEAFAHVAGMTEVLPISRTKYSVGQKVMNVNYFSATEIISTLLKKKVNASCLSNIILVTSIVVNGGKKYQPHYCSSKGALTSLGLAMAVELAPHVRVNMIAPGSFQTAMVAESGLVEKGPWAPNTLLPPGNVDEVAKIIRFLLSDDAAYLTGQILNVDGGEHFPRF